MLGLSRLLVAVSVLAAQGGALFVYASEKKDGVMAREEEGKWLRGLIGENDSTHQDRHEIFKEEDTLKKPPKQIQLDDDGDDVHPPGLSLLDGISTRVIGGKDTTIDQYPYYVRIDLDGKFHCGGTLISSQYILTAAHCNDRGDMTVTLGADTLEQGTGQTYNVAERIPNPNFDESGYADIYDVMLLRIQETADDFFVNNIPLLDDGVSNENKDAFQVIGLGTTRWSLLASKLQVATLNRVDQTTCRDKFLYNNEDVKLQISSDMLCAHAKGKDACQGDSGGPLVIVPNPSSRPSEHILVGLTSWGIGCADDFFPGVYARVSAVVEWIKATAGICQQNLQSAFIMDGVVQQCFKIRGKLQTQSAGKRQLQPPPKRRKRRKRKGRRRSITLSAGVVCRDYESARQNCPVTCNTPCI